MGKNAGRFAIGALIAAAAGYAAGVLTAPKSGKETRKDIKDAANKKISELEKLLKQKHTELSGLIQNAADKANSAKGNAKNEAEELLKKAMQAKDKVRLALSSVRDGGSSDKDLQKAIDDAQQAIDHLKTYIKK
jgi:gas vesicle protein